MIPKNRHNPAVIPPRYKNAINPYASIAELRGEVRTLDKVVKLLQKEGATEEEIDRILMVHLPPRW